MPRNRRGAHGVIISTLLIDLMRTTVELFLRERGAARFADDALLCTAMFLGQAEGKPMTAAKIAEYIGMPRPSAIRKLQALEARGVVEKAAGGKWRIPIERADIDERVTACTTAQMANIRRAMTRLTRLD